MMVVNGQTPRIDGPLVAVIRTFELMFGSEFWNQVVICFTRVQMDNKSVKRRETNLKKTDESRADEYLKVIREKFPVANNLEYLFIDAHCKLDDKEENTKLSCALSNLWNFLQLTQNISTDKVRKVEADNTRLKNENDELKQKNMALEDQIRLMNSGSNNLSMFEKMQGEKEKLKESLTKLQANYDKLKERFKTDQSELIDQNTSYHQNNQMTPITFISTKIHRRCFGEYEKISEAERLQIEYDATNVAPIYRQRGGNYRICLKGDNS